MAAAGWRGPQRVLPHRGGGSPSGLFCFATGVREPGGIAWSVSKFCYGGSTVFDGAIDRRDLWRGSRRFRRDEPWRLTCQDRISCGHDYSIR